MLTSLLTSPSLCVLESASVHAVSSFYSDKNTCDWTTFDFDEFETLVFSFFINFLL